MGLKKEIKNKEENIKGRMEGRKEEKRETGLWFPVYDKTDWKEKKINA